jgi:hypothetical protein
MTRTINNRLHDSNDYEDTAFVMINDFDEYEGDSWECPRCGWQVYATDVEDLVGAQSKHVELFHRNQHVVNHSPSAPRSNSARVTPLASEEIPPHIILRYAHRRAASSRKVSEFYKVLSEFYGIPVPIVEGVPTLGYQDGRKILGAWKGNTIRLGALPSLHTILHEYFHYYSFVNNGDKTSEKSITCKTMDDTRMEELQANDFATKCIVAFEQDFDFKEEFRDLAFKYHPDRGGDSRIFGLIKTAYDFFVIPVASSLEPYSYRPPPSNTQQREYSSNFQRRSGETATTELRNNNPRFRPTYFPYLVGTVSAVFHAISFTAGIFKDGLLCSGRVLHWRYWKRKRNRSGFSRSSFTSSFIAKRITANRIMLGVQTSILLANGLILALLIQSIFFIHYFPYIDRTVLEIGGAFLGAATIALGISKAHLR